MKQYLVAHFNEQTEDRVLVFREENREDEEDEEDYFARIKFQRREHYIADNRTGEFLSGYTRLYDWAKGGEREFASWFDFFYQEA